MATMAVWLKLFNEKFLTHQETVVVAPGRVQLLSSGFRICGLISSVVFTLMTGRALTTQNKQVSSVCHFRLAPYNVRWQTITDKSWKHCSLVLKDNFSLALHDSLRIKQTSFVAVSLRVLYVKDLCYDCLSTLHINYCLTHKLIHEGRLRFKILKQHLY